MSFTVIQTSFNPDSSPLVKHTPYTPKGVNTPERVSTLEGWWQHAAPFGGDGPGDDASRALGLSAFPVRSLAGPFSRVPNTGNSRPVSQDTSAFRQTSGLGCSCCCLRWSSQVCGLAAAMKGTDHTFPAASLRLRRSLPKTRNQRMKDFHSPLALIGQATKQNRLHVVAASLALLIREMKVAETPDAIAFKSLAEAPDKIDAALARGPEALVFYKITSGEVRGIVTEQGDRLEAFARSANADGASVLCFNPSLIATLASMIEPRVNHLIEATSEGVRYDA